LGRDLSPNEKGYQGRFQQATNLFFQDIIFSLHPDGLKMNGGK
jgi:hypothetical protein